MATTSRDARLVLNVEALGQENITKLETALRGLAATGDASSAEFGELADQIGRLGGQSDVLQAVKALSADLAALSTQQDQAAQGAQALVTRLDALKAATNEARTAQEAARAALVAGQQANTQVANDLRALNVAYDAAGKKTSAYRDELQRLVSQQGEAALALVELREANRQATAAVTEAGAEQRKVEAAYNSANRQYEAATTALNTQTAALREAGRAAEELGIDVNDLAGAEAALVSTFTRATTAAESRRAAIEEMSAADREAARVAEGMAALYARGAAALQAEEQAQRDAAKAVDQYVAAKTKVAADAVTWQREAEAIVAVKEAERQALQQTEALVTKLRELAQVEAFEKQAAEAQKMVKAADYVRFWSQSLDEADRKQTELLASTKKVNDAFGQINVRPIEAVTQEIAATTAAMRTLEASGKLTGGALAVAMSQGEAKVAALQREVRELTGSLTLADRASSAFKNSMGQIAAGNLIADGIGSVVEKVKDLAREFVATTIETEQLRKALAAIYKDTTVAGTQFDYLKRAANAAGVSVGQMSQAFVQFSASTRAANIPISVANDLFMSVSRTAGTLGLSADAASGALNALGQMASKGVVSLEELRQQLGDRMPGAMSAAAKGLGLTEAQLIKLVESGSLAARDFFPAFSEGLKEMHGSTEEIIPLWNRFKNLLTETAQGVGDAGGLRIMTVALRTLIGLLGLVIVPLVAVVQAFGALGSAIGIVVASIATFSNPFQALKKVLVDAWSNTMNLAGGFGKLALGLEESGDAARKAAVDIKVGADAARDAEAAYAGLTRAQQAQKAAADIASKAQGDLSAKLVQTNAAIDLLLDAQSKETESLGKLAKATADHGAAMVGLARLQGDEEKLRRASAQAAADQVVALDKVAESQAQETQLLIQKRDLLIKTRTLQGDSTDAIAKETVEIDKKIVASKAEQAQAEGAAEAKRAEALAVRLAADAYADNSKKTAEYAIQLVRANEILAITTQLEKVGAVGKQELKAATEAVAVAQARYSDALKDSVANSQLELRSRQAGLLVAKESLSAEVDLLRAKAEQARNSGLLVTAIDLERAAKRKQIEIDRLLIDIKEVELQMLREELLAKMELLKLEDPNNELKRKELELRLKLTEVQEKQIASSRELLKIKSDETKRSEMLSQNIGNETTARHGAVAATNAQSDAMDKLEMRYKNSSGYTEKQIALLEREAAAAEKAAEAKRKYWNVDKDGFGLDSSGQRMQQSAPTERYVYDTAKSQGLTDQEAIALVDTYMRDGRASGMPQSGPGGASKDWFTVVNEAINEQVMAKARKAASAPSTSTTTSTSSGETTSSGKTVTINLNGKSTAVRVATPTDASNLIGFLRQLENYGGTAS